MMRSCLFMLALVAPLSVSGAATAAYRDELIPETAASRHGLTRMWYSQVQLDRARARVVNVLLDRGTLFVQTDQAMVHALDAETGQTLWAVQVGRIGHPSLRPAANSDVVAVINGSRLYLVNRHNGKLLWEIQVDGVPGAGPALGQQRAYVVTVSGIVFSYLLKPVADPRAELGFSDAAQKEQTADEVEQERRQSMRLQQEYIPPLSCQSAGRAIVQPIITQQNDNYEFVVWPTDRGYLYVGRADTAQDGQFVVRYRLETEAGIAAQPSYLPPDAEIAGDSGIIYAASRDGYVHAILENGGTAFWRFSTGEPLVEPAVVIGKRVFAATQPGGMYCLDAKNGSQLWWCPQVIQFVTASRDRLYVVDRLGQLLVLDISSGARLDALRFPARTVRMLNDQNDRIYLVSETGLVQCLREIENVQPVEHRVEKKPEPAKPPVTKQEGIDQATEKPKGKEKPQGEPPPNPFGGAANPFQMKTVPAIHSRPVFFARSIPKEQAMSSYSRRDFLRQAATGLGAGCAILGSPVADRVMAAGKPAAFKLSVCNETFRDWPQERAFAFAAECGYQGIEIAPFTISTDVTRIDANQRKKLRKLAEKNHLEVTGLHWLLAKTKGLYLTSPDQDIRKATAVYLGELARFCADLGGKIMVFGSPQQRNLRNLVPRVSLEEGMKFAAEVFQSVLPALEKNDVIIGLEPLGPDETDIMVFADDTVKLADMVGSPRVQIILDCKACTKAPASIPELIRKYHRRMVHFHANDPNRRGPGMGELDFVPIFLALCDVNYRGWVSVEVFDYTPGPERLARESIDYMKRVLAQLNR